MKEITTPGGTNEMETHKGCTYWYEVSMHVDKKGDGYHKPAKVRIPVRCEKSGEYASTVTFLASACVLTMDIQNKVLFDSPYPSTACR